MKKRNKERKGKKIKENEEGVIEEIESDVEMKIKGEEEEVVK